jgi:hypothetical protein
MHRFRLTEYTATVGGDILQQAEKQNKTVGKAELGGMRVEALETVATTTRRQATFT